MDAEDAETLMQHYQFSSNIRSYKSGDNFISELTLNKITYFYVGYYYCVQKSFYEKFKDESLKDALENFQASRIYLFVDGKKN